MPTLDLSAFITALDFISTAEELPNIYVGESYLFSNVVLPLLSDETVSLDTLDFSAFDKHDIDALIDRCETMDENELFQNVRTASPSVLTNCNFV